MTDSTAVLAPGQRLLDANGEPIAGAKLKFFEAQTSDPKTVHSDSGLATALGTVVYTDAGGYPVTTQGGTNKTQIYVGSSAYKLMITDADDATIATHDDISGALDTSTFSVEFAKAKEPVISVTTSRALASTDYGKLIQANSTAGSISLTLEPAATAGDGTRIRVRHTGTAGTISITAAGAELIDGPQGSNSSYQLVTFGNEVLLISTGAGWVASALYIPDGAITSAQLSSAISGTFVKTGSLMLWPVDLTAPTGYFDCDGSEKDRTTESELFAVIATKYGVGDGSTTFNLPNYAGVFLRGWDNGAGVDPDAALRTDRGDGTTGDAVGTRQAGQVGTHTTPASGLSVDPHTHNVVSPTANVSVEQGTSSQVGGPVNSHDTGAASPALAISGSVSHTASENRSTNVYVRILIFAGGSAATGASSTFHTLLNGSGDPNDAIGNDDDFYLDTAAKTMWGPKAAGTWAGTSVDISGAPGANGPSPGLDYSWDTGTTDADPGSGKIRVDNATLSSATFLYISKTGRNGESLGDTIGRWDDSTNTNKGHLRIFTVADRSEYIEADLDGALVDATTYWKVPLSSVSGGTAPALSDVMSVTFERTGDSGGGDVTASAAFATDNVIVRADGISKNVQATGVTIDDSDAMAGVTINDFSNLVISDGQHIQIRNDSGSTMNLGDVVYVSGYNTGQGLPLVDLADANGSSTYPAIGIIAETITNNSNGALCVTGRMSGVDTSAFSAGDIFYMSETAGEFSAKPTGSGSKLQRLGIVLRSHATLGVIEITPWHIQPEGILTYVESSPITLVSTADTSYTFAHGLGVDPRHCGMTLQCKTANNGYAVGDRISWRAFRTNTICGDVKHNATEVSLSFDSAATSTYLAPDGGGTVNLVTATNWELILWAEGA